MLARADLTQDELKRFGLTLLQPRQGYRFTLDPLLLCDFSAAGEETSIVDLGTGCGVMALVLARMAAAAHITAFEQDAAAVELTQQNILLNGLGDRVAVLHEDVLQVRRHLPVSSCDLVVSNPPYRKQGRGRLNPHPGKLAARHETTAGLADFLAAAKYLVKPSGRICMVHHPDRLAELMVEAASQKLAVLRLRMVHGLPAAPAKVFLVELSKGRKSVNLQIMPPLLVRSDTDNYTDELTHILLGT
ncbi:methyltransferase [Trichlorobacter lovleyi]|uniref:tRNA1(Val) (adenine(37)-N6)-methyltransferase n=1 Tax=Trichlorobacter lovleyi TaxID=313985 RepID=UPI0022401EE2|nr:methyltransferase [Trichlorobacter lovleyi]QOX79699.1 methyltransferase [Trichlorobacter lovleyi]